MEETTVTIELGKDDIRLAAISVLKHLMLYPPAEYECDSAYYMGVQVIFDVLESTFKADSQQQQK